MPNNGTLYVNAWLDLTDGPLVVTTPDTGDRYYVLGLLDYYTNPFAHVGTRPTGNGAEQITMRFEGLVPWPPAGANGLRAVAFAGFVGGSAPATTGAV